MKKKDLKAKCEYYKEMANLLEKQLNNWREIGAKRLDEKKALLDKEFQEKTKYKFVNKKDQDPKLQLKMLSTLSSIQSRIILQIQLEEISEEESNEFFDFFYSVKESIIDGELGESLF